MTSQLHLFVTDLDNTLVGDRAALGELNTWLDYQRQHYGTKIVYATGRSYASYQTLAQAESLLPPDALVAAVGTEIYWQAGEPWQPWEQHISRGWDRSTVVALAEPLADLHPQPLPEPEPYKVSYYLAADAAVATLPSLRQLLRQANISAEVIYSGHRDLDIIPKGSNKGAAVQFLQNHWQTSVAVACGDSGNDISLFSQGLPHGIVVGNAHSELRLWYELNATDRHYLAQDHYARGIMEGLIYFGFWG